MTENFNYCVGRPLPNSNAISVYAYGTQVHSGTMAEAEEFRTYVNERTGEANFIYKLVPVGDGGISGVEFPKTLARRKEMKAKIRELQRQGYTRFVTITMLCLRDVESPGPDPRIPGFENVGYWPDCYKRKVETGLYNDVILYASK